MEKGIQAPTAQGRCTIIIYMIRWIRTSRLSMKKSLSLMRGRVMHPTRFHATALEGIAKSQFSRKAVVFKSGDRV